MIKTILAAAVLSGTAAAADRQSYSIYVDPQGVMRRSDTRAEVSYYGTNYTLPFAHAYRAMGYLGVDRKQAIRRDVYHLARLGLNAFRLHLWDAELADAKGNLLRNDHLDLLDFLIAELEKRGIDIVLTAQTNFGNGYPEKNIDTGAFTYDFDKCRIHEDAKAQKIQERYLEQLAAHVNPYTGRSYGADRAIIAMEVNNEPCHSGKPGQVTAYINRMVKALRRGGFDKPVLYNVSHNPQVTQAYYAADIQGTTFQWYPTGLVAGHERKGNFLPAVDSYPIPWKDSMPGYAGKARLIYEFDPGDVMASYLYPAIARTLRGEGFQWITQFAYDPIDMARYNTEYQTHFLNLAYTPGKAIGMMIAAEVARNVPRGADYGVYPQNTSFGATTLDAGHDLALYNDGEKFYHTGHTEVAPLAPERLRHIAGRFSSPMVGYAGTGAYFLDRLDSRHWRLEVMPDVLLTEDPFAKPSLSREVGVIEYNPHPVTISSELLPPDFYATTPDPADTLVRAEKGTFTVTPGVWLLSDGLPEPGKWTAQTPMDNGTLFGEYVAPPASPRTGVRLRDMSQRRQAPVDGELKISAVVANAPDSVVAYPADVSFWREDNTLYPLRRLSTYDFEGTVPVPGGKEFRYRLVAYKDGHPYVFPGGYPGTPLDWDFPDDADTYGITAERPGDDVPLMTFFTPEVESGSVPDGQGAWLRRVEATDNTVPRLELDFTPAQGTRAVVRSHSDVRPFPTEGRLVLTLDTAPVGTDTIELGLVGTDGVSYTAILRANQLVGHADGSRSCSVPVDSLKPAPTWLLPAAYPAFMARSWQPATMPAAKPGSIEGAVITLPGLRPGRRAYFPLRSLKLTR